MFLSRMALIRLSWSIAIRHRFAPFFLTVLIALVTPPCSAEESNVVPCDIKLVFGIDDNGMSEVSYDLEMQITNKEGRTIHGVSVHWLDAQSEIIGNSDAICGAKSAGIKLSQSGACRRTVQKIGGRFLEQLGQETWTSIINSEMYNFRAVAYCAIIGYRFGNAAVNRY